MLGAPFAQFVKLNTELRHLWNIDKNNAIASRMAVGALFTYGNATIAPYSEQFYVGGANSIRAFTVRSVGPGGYHPEEDVYKRQTMCFRLSSRCTTCATPLSHLCQGLDTVVPLRWHSCVKGAAQT